MTVLIIEGGTIKARLRRVNLVESQAATTRAAAYSNAADNLTAAD